MTVNLRSLSDQPSALPANSCAYQEVEITGMTPQAITALAQNILNEKERCTIYIPVDPFFRKIKEISDATLLNSLLQKLRESHLSPSKPEEYPGLVTANTKDGVQVSCSKEFIKVAPEEFSTVISTLSYAAATVLITYLSEKKQPESLTKMILGELNDCPYAVQQGAVTYLLEKFPFPELSDEEKISIWTNINDSLSVDAQVSVLRGWYPLDNDDNYEKIMNTFVNITHFYLGSIITKLYLRAKKMKVESRCDDIDVKYESFIELFRGESSSLKDILIQFVHAFDLGPISTSAFPLHAVCEKYRAQIGSIIIKSLKDGSYGGACVITNNISHWRTAVGFYEEFSTGIQERVANDIRAISELVPNARIKVDLDRSNIPVFIMLSTQSKNEEQEIVRLRQQDPQTAKAGYRTVIEKNPKSIATLCLAAILIHEGALTEAEPYLKTALINCVDKEGALASNYAALYHLKKIGLQISFSGNDVQKFEKLLKPDGSYAYSVCKGATHFYKGEYVQARALLTKAHSIKQTDETRKLLGATNYYLQKPNEAHSYFSQVKVPDFFTNRFFGAVLYQRRSYNEAKERLLQAVKDSPDDQFSQMHLGASCFHLGDHDKALGWLTKASDTHFMVKYYLGAIYYHRKDLPNAKKYLQQVYEGNPNDTAFCIPYLGVVLFELKEYEEAATHLQRALPHSYFQRLSRKPQTLDSLYRQVREKLPGADPDAIEGVIKEFGTMTLK